MQDMRVPADDPGRGNQRRRNRRMPKLTMSRLAGTGLAAVLATFALAAPASAAQSGSCSGTLSTPFAAWGDTNLYALAPGGDLESSSGWTFTGGAKLVSESEPFKATGKLGRNSLSMPSGSTATSPNVCLTINHPTFRFFAKAAEGSAASLRAETLATNPAQTIALGAVNGTVAWNPTPSLSTG